MRRLRDYFDIGFAVLWERNRWVLGAIGVVSIAGVTVGVLFATGVLGGGGAILDEQAPEANVTGDIPVLPPPDTSETAADVPPKPVSTPVPTPHPTVVAIRSLDTEANDGPASDPPAPMQVQVPINLKNASDLGSLEFVLVYEPTTMEFVDIGPGALGADPMIETNLQAPGKVWVGIVDPQGVSGDGSIAVVSFRTLEDGQADSPLFLEEIISHSAATLLDAPSRPVPGMLTASDGWFSSPALVYD